MLLSQYVPTCLAHLPITPKTRSNYLGAYRNHLEPRLGARELTEITRAEIAEILAPLAPPTRYQVLMTARVIFREAHLAGLIDASPAATIRAPRVQPRPSTFLTWEQIEATHFGRVNNHVRFLAAHGLRWGEAVALTGDDIRNGRIHIWRSVHGQTKSAAGVRTVPYLGYFEPFPKQRRPLADALRPHNVTIHSLRKTYAYLLKTSGVHVTTAQQLMGHASAVTTLSIYTKVLDTEIDAAGAQLLQRTGITPPPAAA